MAIAVTNTLHIFYLKKIFQNILYNWSLDDSSRFFPQFYIFCFENDFPKGSVVFAR